MTRLVDAESHAEAQRVEHLVVARIAKLAQGDRLQPERELAQDLKVGRGVLRTVLGQLEERGVISRQRRIGTVVNPRALEKLQPTFYMGRKDPRAMQPNSMRRLRNELSHAFADELAAELLGYRLQPMPHEPDHRQVITSGRPTIIGSSGVHLPDAVAFGVCEDLTERVRGWSGAETIWPNLWEASTLGGRIFAIPQAAHVYVLIGNRDQLRKAGIHALPGTWTELRESALRLKQDSGCDHGFGIAADHHLSWLFEDLCYQAGGCTIHGRGDDWRPTLTSEPVVRALSWLRELCWNDQSFFAAPDSRSLVADVASGRCGLAMVECGGFFNDVVWDGHAHNSFEVAPLPSGPAGHRLCQVSLLLDLINAAAPAEERSAGWEWLKLTHSTENSTRYSRYLWQHKLVTGWPPILRTVSYAETGITLPVSWFNTVQDIVARARPQPAGHGWDIDIYLQPILRRILQDPTADPETELASVQRLVRPGLRFLN